MGVRYLATARLCFVLFKPLKMDNNTYLVLKVVEQIKYNNVKVPSKIKVYFVNLCIVCSALVYKMF